MTLPILYSFRRCPYAMRARMILHYSKIDYEHREVDLKNKPQELLEASPKGTVPVLVLANQTVIDESLDVMKYALSLNDPDNLLIDDLQEQANELIANNDNEFAYLLRRFKYPDRYPDINHEEICHQIEESFLKKYEDMLADSDYLLGPKTIADYAILPFIRQYAKVDTDQFEQLPYPMLKKWLYSFINDKSFEQEVMARYAVWSK